MALLIHLPRLRRRIQRWGLFFAAVFALWAFRYPLLRWAGNGLEVVDPPARADAIFVLAGGPFERATQAAVLFRAGYAPSVYALGAQLDEKASIIKDAEISEAAVTALQLRREGVPAGAIELFPEGTSTFEEAQAILALARQRAWKRILVVSTLHHTARIRWVFDELTRVGDPEVRILGASPPGYDPENWWRSEDGLIWVFNEYAKLLYYRLKYCG